MRFKITPKLNIGFCNIAVDESDILVIVQLLKGLELDNSNEMNKKT